MAGIESAERYKSVRDKLGLSQGKLAKTLGVTPQTISAWERGLADPRLDTAQRLAEMANVGVDWLLTGKTSSLNGSAGANVISYIGRGRRVPKIGDTNTRLSAVAKRRSTDYVQTHFACSDKSYALQVVGDSMAPEFAPGDVVVIDPDLSPAPGDFVHVQLEDGTVLFRKYRPHSLRGRPSFTLIPCNPDWPEVLVDGENPGQISGVMSERIVPRRKQ